MALTSLAWLQEHTTGLWRLFSGGLDGSLTEWHLLERRCKQRTDALGGAVWAVAARPQCEGQFKSTILQIWSRKLMLTSAFTWGF